MKQAARAIFIFLLAAVHANAAGLLSVPLENANPTSNNWYFFPDEATAPRIIVKGNQNGDTAPLKTLTGGPPTWTAGAAENLETGGLSVFVPTGGGSGFLVASHLDGTRSINVVEYSGGQSVGVETAASNIPSNVAFGGLSAAVDTNGMLHIAYTLGAGTGSTSCTLFYVRRNTTTNDWAKHQVSIPARVINTSIVASGTSNVVMYFSTSGLHRCTLDSFANGQPLMDNFTLLHLPAQGVVSGAIKAYRDSGIDRIFYFYANSQTTWEFARMDYTSGSNFERKDIQDVPAVSGAFALPTSIYLSKGPNGKQHVAWYDRRSRRIHYLTPGGSADGVPYSASQPVQLPNQPAGVPDSDLQGLHIRNDGAPFFLYRRTLNTGFVAFPADVVPSPDIAVGLGIGSSLPDGSPASFGTVTTGVEKILSFTIRNAGVLPLTGITPTVLTGSTSADFTISTMPATTLAPGETTTLGVRFIPSANGKRSATLNIASNDPDENPFDLALSGTGGPPTTPEIAVAQKKVSFTDGISEVNFGNITTGTTSKAVVLTISNAGLASLTGIAATRDGANPGDFTITKTPLATLGGKKKTSVTITFSPGALGNRTAVLHISSNDADENPFDIVLKGAGVPPVIPEIAVEQPSGTDLTDGVALRDFGPADIGGTTSLTFTVRNTGIAVLKGVTPKFIGGEAKDFILTTKPLKNVAIGGSTAFTVSFKPKAAGLRSTTLRISSNDTDEKFFEISLKGTGVTPLAATVRSASIGSGETLFTAMATAGLEGAAADPEAKPYGDGVGNLLKYAFNMNLGASDSRTLVPSTGTVGLPVVWSAIENGTATTHFEYIRRKNAGLEYTPKFSTDLVSWSSPEGEPVVLPINENWERVVYELPPVSSGSRVGIVEVSLIAE